MDSIDLKTARDMGVAVSNSTGNIATALAEVALSYCVSLLSGLGLQDHEVRKGKWIKPTGQKLEGKKVGILGFGQVGQKLESMLTFLGAKVLVSDPRAPRHKHEFSRDAWWCKIPFLCAPLNSATREIMSDFSFEKNDNRLLSGACFKRAACKRKRLGQSP